MTKVISSENDIKWFHHLLIRFARLVSLFYFWLPRSIQLFFGDVLGLFVHYVAPLRKEIALENMNRAFPEWTNSQLKANLKAMYRHMGRGFVEYFLIPHINSKNWEEYVSVEGLEHVKKELEKGKGVFLLASHMGNGDLGALGLVNSGLPIHLVSKQFKVKWLNEAWYGLRRGKGVNILIQERTHFDILRVLRKNEIVVFVLDQFMGPPVGTRTEFFGHITGTAMGPALFVQRTGSSVVPVWSYRDKKGKINVVIEPAIPNEESETRDETVRHMTQVYTHKIEDHIRSMPDQWMWIHRRWKEFRD